MCRNAVTAGGTFVRKSAVISGQNLSVPFLALFLILLFSAISFAESLSDVKRILTEHQSQPLERIKTLKNEVIKIQGLEEGLARQYRIPFLKSSTTDDA